MSRGSYAGKLLSWNSAVQTARGQGCTRRPASVFVRRVAPETSVPAVVRVSTVVAGEDDAAVGIHAVVGVSVRMWIL